MIMSERVRVEIVDGVAVVTVDSPPLNALGSQALHGLEQAIARLEREPTLLAVVLAGAGGTFMTGADLSELHDLLDDPEAIATHVRWSGTMLARWGRLPQPLIAAVTGDAVSTGFEMLLLCDLVVADPGARFGLPDVALGLVPGAGGTQRLPRRIGMTAAKELLFTGRLVGAAEALRMGIVNQVTEPGGAFAEATALARHIASLPHGAVTAIKQAVEDGACHDLTTGLDHERKLILKAYRSADFRDHMDASLAARQPRIPDR